MALLPLWLLGAPLLLAIVDRIMTPKVAAARFG
jgi:hypothetical protein